MIKSLIKAHKKLILYVLIGGISATIDLIIFLLLYNIIKLNPLLATAISTSVGITNSFTWNILLNFKVRDRLHHRYILFYLVGLTGLLLSISIIFLLHTILGLSANISKVISIPLVVLVQYYFNSRLSLAEKLFSITQLKTTVEIGCNVRSIERFFHKNLNYFLLSLPIIILIVIYFINVNHFGLSYDESYNLQIASNLVNNHSYATNGSVFNGVMTLFDPNISTGPTLLVPIAIIFKLFGIGILQYRLLTELIYSSLLLSIYLVLFVSIRSRLLAFSLGTMFTLLLLSSDISGGFIYSISAIGEPLCALLLILSALLLGRNKLKSAGLIIGLAILTKLIALFALPALCILAIFLLHRRIIKLIDLTLTALLVFFPSLSFEVYRFLSLGHSPSRYVNNVKLFIAFFKSGGSGLASLPLQRPTITARLFTLFNSIQPQFRSLVFLGLALITCCAFMAIIIYISEIHQENVMKRIFKNNACIFLFVTGILWLSWWFSLASVAYFRHVWVGLILILLAVGIVLGNIWEEVFTNRLKYWIVIDLAIYVFAVVSVLVVAFRVSDVGFVTIRSQEHDSKMISAILGNQPMYVFGWWQNPEIQFLTQRKALPVTSATGTKWVIMGQIEKELDPSEYNNELEACDSILPVSHYYNACYIRGDD